MKQYLWNILIWLDQGVNTLLGGDPDETLSSRMGKYKHGAAYWICRGLSLIQNKHCEKSLEWDRGEKEK